jgi:hypothetical protein
MSYKVGDIVRLKFSNNVYAPKGSLLKVESIAIDGQILNVSFKNMKYIVHVNDVTIASCAKEKVLFT